MNNNFQPMAVQKFYSLLTSAFFFALFAIPFSYIVSFLAIDLLPLHLNGIYDPRTGYHDFSDLRGAMIILFWVVYALFDVFYLQDRGLVSRFLKAIGQDR